MKQLYKGPAPAENADIDRLVHDGVLEPIAGKAALPAKAGKNDDVREYLLTVMPPQDADDLIGHRKAKKMPLTRRAAEGLVKHFAATQKEFGWSFATCIDHMTAQGWQGFDVEWIRARLAKKQAPVQVMSHGGAVAALGRLKMKRDIGNGEQGRASETGSSCLDYQRLPTKRQD